MRQSCTKFAQARARDCGKALPSRVLSRSAARICGSHSTSTWWLPGQSRPPSRWGLPGERCLNSREGKGSKQSDTSPRENWINSLGWGQSHCQISTAGRRGHRNTEETLKSTTSRGVLRYGLVAWTRVPVNSFTPKIPYVHSPNLLNDKCISEVVRIGSINNLISE